MPDKPVKVRIAPSPTGPPHVGTAYVALFNYVFAKQNNGKFVLRIEDTDQTRSTKESELAIYESLRWLGLQWDEGPDIGGDCGPYRQSERAEIHQEYARKLIEMGAAYYCFCTPERLEKMRALQRAAKKPSKYDRHCLKLSEEEIKQKLANGEKAVIRLKMPSEGITIINDYLRGEISFENQKIDDQILLKSDGFPTYHLANVVDDHLMGITHVMRAEEWIPSTPKHIAMYNAFGWEPPVFCHLPLLRNKDKSKISKRKNPTSLTYYQRAGYLPETLLNFLALNGWTMPPDRTLKIWDIKTGKEIETRVEHFDTILSVAFSPDGKKIVSGGNETIILWDVETGQEIKTFTGHSDNVFAVVFSSDGKKIISGAGSDDKTIKLWDVETEKEIKTFSRYSNSQISGISSLDFSLDGTKIISGHFDSTITLWDVETGKEIKTFTGHSGNVTSVAFSQKNYKQIISGSSDKTIKLWDIETGKVIKTFKGHKDEINSVAFSPDGKEIISGAENQDRTIKLWDIETEKEIKTFKGHSYEVTSVAFSPDGTKIISGSYDRTIKLWDIETGEEIKTFKRHLGSIKSVAFSPDGKKIISASLFTQEKFTLEEMIENFKLDRISLGGPVFDLDKLRWLNGLYMRKFLYKELRKRIMEHNYDEKYVEKKIVPLIQERIETLEDFAEQTVFFFSEPKTYDDKLVPKKHTPAETRKVLKKLLERLDTLREWNKDTIGQLLYDYTKEIGWKTGHLFMTLRITFTGRKASTPLFETLEVLGPDICRHRLQKILDVLRSMK